HRALLRLRRAPSTRQTSKCACIRRSTALAVPYPACACSCRALLRHALGVGDVTRAHPTLNFRTDRGGRLQLIPVEGRPLAELVLELRRRPSGLKRRLAVVDALLVAH